MRNIPKKKRKHNPNLIRARHSYTLEDIADRFNLHIETVRDWRRQGLCAYGKYGNAFLVYGYEIKRFLQERAKKRKYQLEEDEFFCSKCHRPRKSHPDKVSVENTTKRLGKTHKQAFIKGVCEICNQALLRFSSDRQIKEFRDKGVLLLEHKALLISNGDNSVNTDLERGDNVED